MFNFIITATTIWFLMAVAFWTMFAIDTYVLTPVGRFLSDNPFTTYIVLPFLVIMVMLSAVLMYYKKHPEKVLPGWLQKDCDENPELRKFLNR